MEQKLGYEFKKVVRASLYRLIMAFKFRTPAIISMMLNSLLWFLIIIVPLFFIAGEMMVRYSAIAFASYTLGSGAMWSASSDYRYYARMGVLQDFRISGIDTFRLTLTTIFLDYPLYILEAILLYLATHLIFGISPRIVNITAFIVALLLFIVGYMMTYALTSVLFVYTSSKAPLVNVIQWTLMIGTLVPAYSIKPKELVLLNPIALGCEWWKLSNGLTASWSFDNLIAITVISVVIYILAIYGICQIAERKIRKEGIPEY